MGFGTPQELREPQTGFNSLFFKVSRELPEEALIFLESPDPGGTCIEKEIKTLLKTRAG